MATAVRYDSRPVLWQPHAGPQARFLASDAYEALYGGAAGGGKSDALLFGALRQIDHPSYKALILRRTFPELTELMDRAHQVFPDLGASWNEQKKRYTFPSGATIQFGYCETYKDVLQYQGQQFTYIGFDELGQIAEERIWTYLMSRNRAAAPGLVKQMRGSANPGGPGHHWIKRRFIGRCSPDGIPHEEVLDDGSVITRAFFQAFLADNPTLLQNDPDYGTRLKLLPELEYRFLALGDWDAGAGLAFGELSKARHMPPGFAVQVQPHWTVFGAFDWGYQHPYVFGLFAADDQGGVYLLDALTGRRDQPPIIVSNICDLLERHEIPKQQLRYIAAGHDCWADVKARSEHIPTIAEHFAELRLPLIKANISRIAGAQNVRRYLAWQGTDGKEYRPRFILCDTPGTRKVWETLETRVSDPDKPEDVLKTDADESGEGGDDAYDMVRYGLASRPITGVPKKIVLKQPDRAMPFDYEKRQFVKPTYPGQTVGSVLEQMDKPDHRPRVPRWTKR